jgi:hypothetical protein
MKLVDMGNIPKESADRGRIPKESLDKGRNPKEISDRGSIPKESYPFPLMSKGERMRRCRETKRKIIGINIEGAMVTGGA